MILDIIILLIIVIGLLIGWKLGILTSALNLFSSILVFVVAYLIKGPVSLILIEHLPFISFDGIFSGITTLNVMLYEGIAFVICVLVLGILCKILLSITKIFNKLINATVILGLPNKLGGAIINGLKYFVYAFVIIFVLSLIPSTTTYVKNSTLSKSILNNTPILSNMTKDLTKSFTEIYDLVKELDDNTDKKEINAKSLEILLKYDIITTDTAKTLYEDKKIDIDNFDELIKQYE